MARRVFLALCLILLIVFFVPVRAKCEIPLAAGNKITKFHPVLDRKRIFIVNSADDVISRSIVAEPFDFHGNNCLIVGGDNLWGKLGKHVYFASRCGNINLRIEFIVLNVLYHIGIGSMPWQCWPVIHSQLDITSDRFPHIFQIDGISQGGQILVSLAAGKELNVAEFDPRSLIGAEEPLSVGPSILHLAPLQPHDEDVHDGRDRNDHSGHCHDPIRGIYFFYKLMKVAAGYVCGSLAFLGAFLAVLFATCADRYTRFGWGIDGRWISKRWRVVIATGFLLGGIACTWHTTEVALLSSWKSPESPDCVPKQ